VELEDTVVRRKLNSNRGTDIIAGMREMRIIADILVMEMEASIDRG
jgi:hypothetical protein